MTTREELYRKWSPMLLEAVVMVIRDEINILRQDRSLPERTNQQVMNAVTSKLDTLEEYNWVKELKKRRAKANLTF